MQDKKLLLVGGCILASIIICCTSVFIYFGVFYEVEPDIINTEPDIVNSDSDDENTDLGISTLPSDIDILYESADEKLLPDSIYDDTIEFTSAKKTDIGELVYLVDAMKILQSKNWDGEGDMPISMNDFSQDQIDFYLTDEADRNNILTIPDTHSKYFLNPEAGQSITKLISQARNEYLDYLKSRGVKQEYIDEINQYTFPNNSDRYEYFMSNDPNDPPTATYQYDGTPDDSSQRQMDIYAIDIYNGARIFENSAILGGKPSDPSEYDEYYLKLRDMSLRYYMYHEMTHVLQKAVDSIDAGDEYKTFQSSHIYVEDPLWKTTSKYHRDWGESDIFSDGNNRQISLESQAEGVSYELLTNIYHMSDVQKRLIWEYQYSRLEKGQSSYNEAFEIFEQSAFFDNYNFDEIGSDLNSYLAYEMGNSETKEVFKSMNGRLGALGPYGGYLFPMTVDESTEFWEHLQNGADQE